MMCISKTKSISPTHYAKEAKFRVNINNITFFIIANI